MKSNLNRSLLALAILSFASASFAGNNNGPDYGNVTNNNQQYNTANNNQQYGGAGGNATGVGVGVGVGLGGAGGTGGQGGNAASTNFNQNTSTSSANGGYAAGGSASGGSASSSTGASATGIGTGNQTSVSSVYEAASASAYAPTVPTTLRSCRLYIGLGGASRDGSGSGGIPIGNDATCLADSQLALMATVNRAYPGTYSKEDYLLAACKVEGMSAMKACAQQ